jgi:NAD(P)H-dependent flavin oxidoreductase YrpB (nitropropane dioxygenase family)
MNLADMNSTEVLSKWFPHVCKPFICNAPMFGTANAILAASVAKAGGFGNIYFVTLPSEDYDI